MVKIIGYQVRQNFSGNTFIRLELQGDIVMVQSQDSGRFYATSKKAKITSTFNEDTAQSLIGKEIPGRIERIECGEYEFTVPETGEVITLNHRYEYLPEGAPTPITVVHEGVSA